MFNLWKLSIILFPFLFLGVARGQAVERVNTFAYNVNEGLLQSHINDIAFDKYNFAWLSFENGIQKFDGANFSNVPIQSGLPEDKNVRFFTDDNNILFISHLQGISLYNAKTGKFKLLINFEVPEMSPPQFLGTYNGSLYTSTNTGKVYVINLQDYSSENFLIAGWPKIIGAGVAAAFPANIENGETVAMIDSLVFLIDIAGKKIIQQKKINASSSSPFNFTTNGRARYFILSGNNGLLTEYDFNTHKEQVLKVISSNLSPLRASTFIGDGLVYNSYYNRLYVSDKTDEVQKEYVSLQNEPIAGNDIIDKISKDNYGNIYLVTINAGFRIITPNQFGLKYYGVPGHRKSFATSLCVDKPLNRVLVGTYGNGVLVFDTAQKLIQHITNLPGEDEIFTPSSIIKTGANEYMIMPWGGKKGYLYSFPGKNLKPVKMSPPPLQDNFIDYYGNKIKDVQGGGWLQTNNYLFKVSSNTINWFSFSFKLGLAAVFYGNDLVSFNNNSLIFYDTATKANRAYELMNTGGVRCMATDGKYIYIGGNKGVFKINNKGKLLFHKGKKEGLADECIYAIHVEKNGDIWGSTNRGLFKLTPSHEILQITKEDGLQENEFNTNVVEQANDGELFFGGVNGVSSFFPDKIAAGKRNIAIIFTGIKVNNKEYFSDTAAAWAIKKIALSHNENSLSFDFIARLNDNPQQLVYQYRMLSVDEEWLQTKGTQTATYILPPGKYTFQVFASRLYDPQAKPLAQIVIVISPPFWKTWWFMSLCTLTAGGILYFIVSRNVKNKFNKTLALMAQENEMQQEREKISKDLHDSIGAYANVVLYKTELLQKENEAQKSLSLVSDLRFASRDIITSLRENIWALKHNSFTTEECLLRMKNFILNLSRYYPDIHFKIDGEAPQDKELHYRNALHAVRIIQEAITNTVKHANPKNVILRSLFNENEWKIEISDDGTGFTVKIVEEDYDGNGLENMKHRAKEAGFHLVINSNQAKGTHVKLNIPLI